MLRRCLSISQPHLSSPALSSSLISAHTWVARGVPLHNASQLSVPYLCSISSKFSSSYSSSSSTCLPSFSSSTSSSCCPFYICFVCLIFSLSLLFSPLSFPHSPSLFFAFASLYLKSLLFSSFTFFPHVFPPTFYSFVWPALPLSPLPSLHPNLFLYLLLFLAPYSCFPLVTFYFTLAPLPTRQSLARQAATHARKSFFSLPHPCQRSRSVVPIDELMPTTVNKTVHIAVLPLTASNCLR